MTIEDLIVYGKSLCHSDQVKLLLGDLLSLNPLELYNHLDDYVEEDKVNIFKKEVESLHDGIPIQYVIGSVNFYGNKFKVNKNVLIPRFETEELVENTIKYIEKRFNDNSIRVLDIGCGSGIIGITLKKKFPNATVDMIDISKDALVVARENAKELECDVNITQSDLFQNIDSKYDVIISNPPYIMDDEEIEEIVKNNEPHIALYGGIDGLDIYRRILKEIKNYLNNKFLIAFEIGMTQKDEIEKLTRENLGNVDIECKKDMSEKNRMIFIKSE